MIVSRWILQMNGRAGLQEMSGDTGEGQSQAVGSQMGRSNSDWGGGHARGLKSRDSGRTISSIARTAYKGRAVIVRGGVIPPK